MKTGEQYLEEMRQIAEANGGRLLTDEWLGSHAKYLFAIENDRCFEMTAAKLKSRGWPKNIDSYFRRYDKNRSVLHLETLRRIADENGGRLLSTEWRGARVNYQFVFADGSEFEARPSSIINQGWPKVSSRHLKHGSNEKRGSIHLQEMRLIAEENGGKLLSEEWEGSKKKHRFAFADGREFSTTKAVLLSCGWPRNPDRYFKQFGKNRGAIHLEELRQIAIKRGGRLLSNQWRGASARYWFVDQYGMQFQAIPGNVRKGKWSPYVGRISEHVCRQAMQYLLGREFLSTWSIVKRDGKRPLQLDGYAQSVQMHGGNYDIAFEYQGDRSHRDDHNVISRDLEKKKFCYENDIILVVINPFRDQDAWESSYVVSHVADAVNTSLMLAGINPVSFDRSGFRVEMTQIHDAVEGLDRLRVIAEANGGKLLSKEWQGVDAKYHFAFADGRTFQMRAAHLKNLKVGWPKNANLYFRKGKKGAKPFLNELRQLAEANGGRVISTEWCGSKAKYRFAFVDGKEFEVTWGNLKRNGWPKDPDRYLDTRYAAECVAG